MNPRVAVIDIGSNSIKSLVAERGPGRFGIKPLLEESREVRISQGIGGHPPCLQADRIEAGIEAVRALWERCLGAGPLTAACLVATSAVRSVGNGQVFLDAVTEATGHEARVLSGSEEAEAIADGVRTDPDVEEHLVDFTVFDLGGGSLELIRFEHHGVTERTSLPLGAVRLTDAFIDDPAVSIPVNARRRISAHVREQIEATGTTLTSPLVGCSGGLVAVRQLVAGSPDFPRDAACARIPRRVIRDLLGRILRSGITDRLAIPGMPARRADILPAALIVFDLLMDLAGAEEILHSLHSLRYGLAFRLLNGKGRG